MFGAIERVVRALNESLHVLFRLGNDGRHADAHCQVNGFAFPLQWRGFYQLPHAFGHHAGALEMGVAEKNRKFLAAVAGHEISRSIQAVFAQLGHVFEAGIAGQVAVSVVDLFEVVHIQQEQGHVVTGPGVAPPLSSQVLVEEGAVFHLGQAVDRTHFLKASVGTFQFLGSLGYPGFQMFIGFLLYLQGLLLGGAGEPFCGQGIALRFIAPLALQVDPVGEGKGEQQYLQGGTELRGIFEQDIAWQHPHFVEHQHGVAQQQHAPGQGIQAGQYVALGPEVNADRQCGRCHHHDHQRRQAHGHAITDHHRKRTQGKRDTGATQGKPAQEAALFVQVQEAVGEQQHEANVGGDGRGQYQVVQAR